jgi:TolB protein
MKPLVLSLSVAFIAAACGGAGGAQSAGPVPSVPVETQPRATVGPAASSGAAPAQTNSRIAFVSTPRFGFRSDNELYVVNADGSGQRRLTSISSLETPSWSPDGRRIAFRRQAGGKSGIYVVSTDGSGVRRLTGKWSFGAAWSPDGRRIAVWSARDGNGEVYVMNADGSGQLNLTRNPRWARSPFWSPAGRKIAFDSVRDGSRDLRRELRRGGLRRLTQPEARLRSLGRPTEDRLRSHGDLRRGHRWQGLRRLTRNPASDSIPSSRRTGARSPSRPGDGNLEVYIMNPDGSGQRTDAQPVERRSLAWSPGQKSS